jgi:hypothetical protein
MQRTCKACRSITPEDKCAALCWVLHISWCIVCSSALNLQSRVSSTLETLKQEHTRQDSSPTDFGDLFEESNQKAPKTTAALWSMSTGLVDVRDEWIRMGHIDTSQGVRRASLDQLEALSVQLTYILERMRKIQMAIDVSAEMKEMRNTKRRREIVAAELLKAMVRRSR